MSDFLYVKCGQCGTVNRFEVKTGRHPTCGKCDERLNQGDAASDSPLNASDSTFSEDVLGTKIPVLVDFFATWCGACRSLDPTLVALASRYKGKLKVLKLDVDQNPMSVGRHQIQATPTLILLRNGQVVEQVTGALPEQQMRNMIEKHMS